MSMESLYLQAWIAGLKERSDAPPVRAVSSLSGYVPLRYARMAPYVCLRPSEREQ